MSTALVSLFLVVLTICVLLNLVMLPGNWAVVGLTALYAWLGPETPELGALFFVALVGMAVVGEVVEFLTQIWGAKKYGSSGKATFAGMIGAIAGAIFFAPFLFGHRRHFRRAGRSVGRLLRRGTPAGPPAPRPTPSPPPTARWWGVFSAWSSSSVSALPWSF